MAHIYQTQLASYSALKMYRLIADVDSYASFLPGCLFSQVLSSQGEQVVARLEVGGSGIQRSFVTRNSGIPGIEIEIQLVEGPFHTLRGHWYFAQLPSGGCSTTLDLHFKLKSPWTELLLTRFSARLAGSLLTAIGRRATAIYGQPD